MHTTAIGARVRWLVAAAGAPVRSVAGGRDPGCITGGGCPLRPTARQPRRPPATPAGRARRWSCSTGPGCLPRALLGAQRVEGGEECHAISGRALGGEEHEQVPGLGVGGVHAGLRQPIGDGARLRAVLL